MTQAESLANPYIAGSPLTRSEMFFGREDVFEFVRKSLVGLHQDNIIVLYGQRRTGKTSVLYQMRHHLEERYVPILIDLQGLSLNSMSNFFWEIATHIQRQLRRDWDIHLPRPEMAAYSENPLEQFQEGFLQQVWEVLGERHILLMIDEALRLDEQVQAGSLEPQVFDYIRSLMQHNQQLDFIFSVGTRLGQLEGREFGLLLNTALYKEISFLSHKSAVTLVTQPVQDVFQLSEEAINRILDVTSGHAYYTQLLCHSLFSRYAGEWSVITAKDVENVLPEVVERGTVNLKYVWDDSSQQEKLILVTMSEITARENRLVMEEEIGIVLRGHEIYAPPAEVSMAFRSLVGREVLVRVEAYSYKFSVDLMRMWLVENQRIDWLDEKLLQTARAWQRPAEATAVAPARRVPRLLVGAGAATVLLGVILGGILYALPMAGEDPQPSPSPTATSGIVAPTSNAYALTDGHTHTIPGGSSVRYQPV